MLDWAKAVHEAIGIESPRLFIGVFALVGFILFGVAGWIIDRGYRVKLREQKAQAVTLPAAAMIGSTEPKPYPTAVPTTRDNEPAVPLSQERKETKNAVKGKSATVTEPPPSRSGDINIGANSPVTGSTINTGTINYGPPKAFILTSEDQQKARGQLMAASAELRLICIGQGCQTANSLAPAFAGTEWKLQRVTIGTYTSVTAGPDGATTDTGAGIHLMEREADANAVVALKSALDSVGIKYDVAPWMPIGPMPTASGIILIIGNPTRP
jgi:hypothetical protein